LLKQQFLDQPTHFKGNYRHTCCGKKCSTTNFTDDKDKVTCGGCKRTVKYKNEKMICFETMTKGGNKQVASNGIMKGNIKG